MKTKKLIRGRAPQALIEQIERGIKNTEPERCRGCGGERGSDGMFQHVSDDCPVRGVRRDRTASKIYDTTVVVTLADGSHRVTSFRNGAEYASFKLIVRAMRDSTTIHAATGAAVFEGSECFRYTANEVVELMTDRRYA